MNRVLVDKSIHAEFAEILAVLAEETELGNGVEPGVEYGPVLNDKVIERVEAHRQDATAKGGRLIAGGVRPEGEEYDRGHFYRPTIIDGAPPDSLPMTSETYGPLAAMASFDSVEQMIAMANSLEYGLAAYLYGSDLERMWAIADKLEFGGIGINVNDVSELQAPSEGGK